MTIGNSTILANMTHPARQSPGRPPESNRTRTVQVASDPKESPAAQQKPYSQGTVIQTVTAAVAAWPAVPMMEPATAAAATAAIAATRLKSTAHVPNACQPVASTTGMPFPRVLVRLRALSISAGSA